jgi:hypothetical protein
MPRSGHNHSAHPGPSLRPVPRGDIPCPSSRGGAQFLAGSDHVPMLSVAAAESAADALTDLDDAAVSVPDQLPIGPIGAALDTAGGEVLGEPVRAHSERSDIR